MDSMRAIDQFILDVVDSHWRKVAMVIARAMCDRSLEFPDVEDEGEFVASRIARLVERGELESVGNLEDWRFSEVRRPPAPNA